mgnify:CR=1 FL=1
MSKTSILIILRRSQRGSLGDPKNFWKDGRTEEIEKGHEDKLSVFAEHNRNNVKFQKNILFKYPHNLHHRRPGFDRWKAVDS